MYKVLIVEDEPISIQYVKKIIELKMSSFEVCGTAENGCEALVWIQTHPVDVLVSDVMMEEMNGIERVSTVHERYPDVVSIIISGYQDFEFVQGAIRAGVCDYLLKPINPEEMQKLFVQIKKRLDRNYYMKRNRILHQLSLHNDRPVDLKELARVFQGRRYYAAIIRKNGLISRFVRHAEEEIYSMQDEQIIIYGRDGMEMLYIYPEELIVMGFPAIMNKAFYKQQDEGVFLTMVLKEEPFEIEELPDVMKELYRTLDRVIVIGVEQKIILGQQIWENKSDKSDKQFDQVMYQVKSKDIQGALKKLEALFSTWQEEKVPQFYVEEKIRYLFYEMLSMGILEKYNEYLFDDVFSNVVNMQELCGNICEFICQNLVTKSLGKNQDKREVFQKTTDYMSNHLSESLSVQSICKQFGISQATLNRLFRSFAGKSYNSYLTDLRINKSRELFEEYPDAYIKDVAAAVGYGDQFYFSRLFRSVTGVSPSEYIENCMKKAEDEKRESPDMTAENR